MLRRNTGVKVFAANEEIVLDRGMPEYVSVSLYCFALFDISAFLFAIGWLVLLCFYFFVILTLLLSIGQTVLLCLNCFYLLTFALMPRGHILSDQSVRKYAKNAFRGSKTLSVVLT